MQSAEDIANMIIKAAILETSHDLRIRRGMDEITKSSVDLIRARDRGIVEECKKAIEAEARLYSPNVMKFDYSYCWAILENVLRDLD